MPNADDFARLLQQAAMGAASSATSGGSPSRGSRSAESEPLVFFKGGKSRQAIAYQRKATTAGGGGRQLRDDEVAGRPTITYRPYKSGVLKPVKGPDDVRSYSDALGAFYGWSDKERKEWGRYLASIGYIDEEDADDYSTLLKAWNEVIDESARFTAAGKKMDPWAVARVIAGADNDGGGAGGGRTRAGRERGFTGTRSATSTSTQVDLTDGATAKSLVNQTLSKFLGRNATDEEIRAFTATLHAAEKDNPVKASTTTTDTFADGIQTGSTSSTTTSGGLSAAGKAQTLEDRAISLPEHASYQAAGFYMPLLFQAIGATV